MLPEQSFKPQSPFPRWQLPAPLNALAWSQPSEDEPNPTLAVISGNGTLYLLRAGMDAPLALPIAPDAALLSLVTTPHGFITGSDTGHLHLITPKGEITPLTQLKNQFVEHLTYSNASEHILAAHGKTLSIFTLQGELHTTHTLPSTIGGLATSPIGRKVAASHYNGATIIDLANAKAPPRLLEWKGSHLALTYSPDGKWLISAMQEQSLHLWRLSDSMDLQMRGYPGPITQLSWAQDEITLATNGGTGVPLWSFKDKLKGPAGTQAKVVADSGNAEDHLVTSIAMHPKGPFLAAGYTDGLALLCNTTTSQSILLQEPLSSPSPLAHMAWSPNGMLLAFSTESGALTLADFAQLV